MANVFDLGSRIFKGLDILTRSDSSELALEKFKVARAEDFSESLAARLESELSSFKLLASDRSKLARKFGVDPLTLADPSVALDLVARGKEEIVTNFFKQGSEAQQFLNVFPRFEGKIRDVVNKEKFGTSATTEIKFGEQGGGEVTFTAKGMFNQVVNLPFSQNSLGEPVLLAPPGAYQVLAKNIGFAVSQSTFQQVDEEGFKEQLELSDRFENEDRNVIEIGAKLNHYLEIQRESRFNEVGMSPSQVRLKIDENFRAFSVAIQSVFSNNNEFFNITVDGLKLNLVAFAEGFDPSKAGADGPGEKLGQLEYQSLGVEYSKIIQQMTPDSEETLSNVNRIISSLPLDNDRKSELRQIVQDQRQITSAQLAQDRKDVVELFGKVPFLSKKIAEREAQAVQLSVLKTQNDIKSTIVDMFSSDIFLENPTLLYLKTLGSFRFLDILTGASLLIKPNVRKFLSDPESSLGLLSSGRQAGYIEEVLQNLDKLGKQGDFVTLGYGKIALDKRAIQVRQNIDNYLTAVKSKNIKVRRQAGESLSFDLLSLRWLEENNPQFFKNTEIGKDLKTLQESIRGILSRSSSGFSGSAWKEHEDKVYTQFKLAKDKGEELNRDIQERLRQMSIVDNNPTAKEILKAGKDFPKTFKGVVDERKKEETSEVIETIKATGKSFWESFKQFVKEKTP